MAFAIFNDAQNLVGGIVHPVNWMCSAKGKNTPFTHHAADFQ
jgi:hypothetical protein